jgi:pyruvyl transferase EpsI
LSKQKKIWFLDSPSYGNLGDQSIAYATAKFLKDNLPDYQLIEVMENKLISCLSYLKRKIEKEDLVVLQGGGNLGNLYSRYEFLRRQVIKNFPDNKIIIFPQSIYFSDTAKGRKEQKISSEIYGKHKNLIVCARDSKAASVMQQVFFKNKICLCPDIALYLINLVNGNNRSGVGVCLREDSEKIPLNESQNRFLQNIYKKYRKIETLTTLSLEKQNIVSNLREKLVLEKLKEFSKYQLIITDRLHGMIFAYITSTPCIVFTSKTEKAENLYKDWLKDCSFVSIYNGHEKLDSIFENCKPESLNFSNLISVLQETKGFKL